jgi:hypothetical protein
LRIDEQRTLFPCFSQHACWKVKVTDLVLALSVAGREDESRHDVCVARWGAARIKRTFLLFISLIVIGYRRSAPISPKGVEGLLCQRAAFMRCISSKRAALHSCSKVKVSLFSMKRGESDVAIESLALAVFWVVLQEVNRSARVGRKEHKRTHHDRAASVQTSSFPG